MLFFSKSLSLRLAALACLCILTPLLRAANFPFNQIVVFGDSVSDDGNGSIIWNSQSSAPWQAATPQNNYSNNRYTDGPDTQPATSQPALIWTDRLAEKLNLAAPAASLAGGTDYAAYGATVSSGNSQYPSTSMQVQQALANGVSANALYIFWGGANDITNQSNPNSVTPAAIAAAQGVQQQIAALAAAGARYFVWLSMPPFERIPGASSNSSALNDAFAQASIAFDQTQAAAVAQLQLQYQAQGVIVVSVDIYGLFSSILNSPQAYGFSNITDSAAGQFGVNPDGYFFWKNGHFTTTGHAAIADEIYRTIQRGFGGAGSATANPGPANGKVSFANDGRTDYTVWRPTNGTWYVSPNNNPGASRTQQWGSTLDVPVPGDYDGDGIADYAVWRPFNGTWYIILSSRPSIPTILQWGVPGDVPVPGDYDGDGRVDAAVWRPYTGTWYVLPSTNPGSPVVQQWGLPGDVPVYGDFDGDKRTDFVVWRPSSGVWYATLSSNPFAPYVRQWGLIGDVPQ